MRLRFFLILAFATLLLIPLTQTGLGAQQETVVFLVRHAERADDAPGDPGMVMDPQMAEDPPLSDAGRARSALLAGMLVDAGITRVHSTDYRRTRETAQPTAEAMGLPVDSYDASDPDAFASDLRSAPGRHLVVGHSNTTPNLVKALGGDPGDPIEALEYDRLYVLVLGEAGVRTLLLRFGAPFVRGDLPLS